MEFTLSQECLELRDKVRDYANRHVRPEALKRERIEDPQERFPWDWVEDLSAMGVRTLALPKELGGFGADTVTCCVIGEELAAGDLGLAVIFDQTWKLTPLLCDLATPYQRDLFLERFKRDARFLLAVGVNEPDAGSDHFLPYNEPGAGARTSAVRDGDHWVLNGEKAPISNGGVAQLYIIMARTEPDTGGVNGLTAFFVPADTPGFSVDHIYDKSAQRLVHNGLLVMRDCRIPANQMLGTLGNSMATYRQALAGRGFPEAGATALGAARAAMETAWQHAETRIQGGVPIIEHQSVMLMLAEMQTQIEAARTLIWRAAWDCDHPEAGGNGTLALQSKVFASEVAFKVAGMALRVLGRFAILREECAAEKYLRDTSSFLHSEGQNEILLQRMVNISRGRAKPF